MSHHVSISRLISPPTHAEVTALSSNLEERAETTHLQSASSSIRTFGILAGIPWHPDKGPSRVHHPSFFQKIKCKVSTDVRLMYGGKPFKSQMCFNHHPGLNVQESRADFDRFQILLCPARPPGTAEHKSDSVLEI